MFQESYMRKIAAAFGVVAVIALLAYTYSTIKSAQYFYNGPTSITVTGEGEVFAKPDIASFNFSVEGKDVSATVAQNEASEIMDAIVAYLKDAGIEEKDIKTSNYSLYPEYEYPAARPCTEWSCPPPGEQKLKGYIVNQSVDVKVRDTDKAGEIISEVGEKGAMNVSGLSFTIDDEDALKVQARELAIADAKEKAKVLAENLGVRIVRMTSYWEHEGYPQPYYEYGMGGDMVKARDMAVPESAPANLPPGENRITAKVDIAYEVR